ENVTSLRGRFHPETPRRVRVLGMTASPAVSAAPQPVDLAIIATPARTVPGIVAECAAAHVPAAIVISAGFKEAGPRGAELEREILAARGSVRFIGPNCPGVRAPGGGLKSALLSTPTHPPPH